MSEPMSSGDIDRVLANIRKLVSVEHESKPRPKTSDRLVLTSELKVGAQPEETARSEDAAPRAGLAEVEPPVTAEATTDAEPGTTKRPAFPPSFVSAPDLAARTPQPEASEDGDENLVDPDALVETDSIVSDDAGWPDLDLPEPDEASDLPPAFEVVTERTARPRSLQDRIADLQAALGADAGADFEPDGSEDLSVHQPDRVPSFSIYDLDESSVEDAVISEEIEAEPRAEIDAKPHAEDVAPELDDDAPPAVSEPVDQEQGGETEIIARLMEGDMADVPAFPGEEIDDEDDELSFGDPDEVEETSTPEEGRAEVSEDPFASAHFTVDGLGTASSPFVAPQVPQEHEEIDPPKEEGSFAGDLRFFRASAEDRFPGRTVSQREDPLEIHEDEELIDEEALRDIVAEIVREELSGALGERITRNVRKLVRREIQRALSARDFD